MSVFIKYVLDETLTEKIGRISPPFPPPPDDVDSKIIKIRNMIH